MTGSLGIYLETERLVLRRFTAADADNLCDLDGDALVMRYVSGGRPTTRRQIEELVLPKLLWFHENYDNLGFFATESRDGGEFLGWFHLRPYEGSERVAELGYRFRRSAWGKGYATEGSRALVRRGFTELGLERIVACAMAGNAASIRVMEKAGLTFDRRWFDDESELELVRYAVDRPAAGVTDVDSASTNKE